MEVSATWRIVGIVSERRVLKSEKSKDWRGHLLKVMTLGATFEVNVSEEQHAAVGDGQMIEAVGRFEQRATDKGGIVTKFIATTIGPAGKGAARG